MKPVRIALLWLLAVAVPAQSLAVMHCPCDSHGGSAVAEMMPDADHMSHGGSEATTHQHAMDHDGTHGCGHSGIACKCGACGHLLALPGVDFAMPVLAGTQADSPLTFYIEPVPSPSFRPPILL